jgi:hypothetical protein
MISTAIQIDSFPLPAPSVADLERWFEEDVAEWQAAHPSSKPIKCDLLEGHADSTDSGDSLPTVISPPAADRPDEEQGIVSLSTPSRMIETIYIPSSHALALAVYSPTKKAVEHLSRVLASKSLDKKKQGDSYYVPVASKFDLPGRGVLLLPSEAGSYGTQSDLVDSIKRFVHRYADLPEFWEDLIAHYILMTWVFDRFSAVPYLRFLGEPGTGKTRALQVAGALAYKSIFTSGASSISPFFRLIDQWGGTLVIDEADYSNSDATADITKILNNGYMPGLPVFRADGKNFDPRPFDVFGPKILSTRKRFDDYATETRCLTYESIERPLRADVPLQLPPEFHEEARNLRNKLLRWRFDNFERIKLDDAKLRQIDARLGQIGSSIFAVATDESFRTELVKYFSRQGKRDKSQRPQALVLESVRRLMEKDASNVKKHDERLAVKDVAATVGSVSEDWGLGKDSLSPKATGAIIRSLGFKPERKKHGYRFAVDPEKLAELLDRYDLKD